MHLNDPPLARGAEAHPVVFQTKLPADRAVQLRLEAAVSKALTVPARLVTGGKREGVHVEILGCAARAANFETVLDRGDRGGRRQVPVGPQVAEHAVDVHGPGRDAKIRRGGLRWYPLEDEFRTRTAVPTQVPFI